MTDRPIFVSPQTPSHAWLLGKRYRVKLLIVLLLTSILNFMDRAILSAAIEPMRQDLGLSDSQIGLLQGVAFGLVYALLALPVGRLAEHVSRKIMLACSTLVFSIMSALCGSATTFPQLFFMRAGVGAGEAAFLPPAISLLADHHPAERRASVFSIINLGSPFGYLIGSVGGAAIIAMWGWRTAFMLTAIPGIIVALLLLTVLSEPPRGLVDGKPADRGPPPPLRRVVQRLWGFRSFRHILVGGSVTMFASYAHAQFLFPFFIRSQGLTSQQAGVAVGLIAFLSIGGGSLLGGFGVDWMRRRDIRWSAWMPAIGVLAACGFYATGFLSHTLSWSIPCIILGGTSLFTFYAPTYANVQNLVPSRMRASAIGILGLVLGIIGAGFGPTGTGLISDTYAHLLFAGDYQASCLGGKAISVLGQHCHLASAQGLRFALATVTLFYIWGAFHFWRASKTISDDLQIL